MYGLILRFTPEPIQKDSNSIINGMASTAKYNDTLEICLRNIFNTFKLFTQLLYNKSDSEAIEFSSFIQQLNTFDIMTKSNTMDGLQVVPIYYIYSEQSFQFLPPMSEISKSLFNSLQTLRKANIRDSNECSKFHSTMRASEILVKIERVSSENASKKPNKISAIQQENSLNTLLSVKKI
ncbi:hypothetical protein GQX74_003585, partial [Glossina fuscipes]